MALQVHSSEVNTTPALKSFLHSTIPSVRNLFIFSKTLPFIGGLVVSYKFVEIAVLSNLQNYLTDADFMGKNQRIGVVVTNLHDALSSILLVFVSPIAEACMGSFTMITLCAAASVEGLMLLWTSISTLVEFPFYAAIFLLALCKSGQMLSENFLECQLEEKIKAKKEREQDYAGKISIFNIWLLLFNPYLGYGVTVCVALTMEEVDYEYIFMVAALLMGGTHLLFLFCYPGYRLEELSGVNNLRMIYRVCKAAFGKRKSKYPATANSYYWKNYKQGHLYERGEGKGQRLYPKVPRLFRWLDKAAIIEGEECSDPKEQEKKGNLCMVKEVREVKSLVPMIYLCFSIFGYSLLSATGTTFFVSQVDIMTPVTRSGDNWILFLIWDGMARFICFIIKFSFRRRLKTFKRKAGSLILGFGLLSAVSCSLVAWRVEARRLSIIHIENGDLNQGGRNTTMALVPQFVLIGIADGLVEGGLRSLFQGTVANSLLSLVGLFIEMVIGTGKLLIIPVVFIFSFWIKETINTSHLDRYYLMLGILNAAFLIVYGYYSIRYVYKEVWSVDEEVTVEHPDAPPVHQPNTHQENDNNDMQQDLLQENDDNEIPLEVEIDQPDLFQENNDNEEQLVVNQPDSLQENDDEAQLLDQPDSHQENDDNEENLLDQGNK